MTRQEANLEILEDLTILVKHFPDLRFHQILWVVGMEDDKEDRFNEESVRTLQRLKDNLNFNLVLEEFLK